MKARLCLTAFLLYILPQPELLRARDYFLNNYRLLHFLIHQANKDVIFSVFFPMTYWFTA